MQVDPLHPSHLILKNILLPLKKLKSGFAVKNICFFSLQEYHTPEFSYDFNRSQEVLLDSEKVHNLAFALSSFTGDQTRKESAV